MWPSPMKPTFKTSRLVAVRSFSAAAAATSVMSSLHGNGASCTPHLVEHARGSRLSSFGAERETVIVMRAVGLIGVPPHRVPGRIGAIEHHVVRQLVVSAFGVKFDAAVVVQGIRAVEGMAVSLVTAPAAVPVALARIPF